ncbi:cytochrome P450 [Rhizorhabdus dicambivorans]|nr:cytochrome P450 [Rhizorhabdus dicambivorans]
MEYPDDPQAILRMSTTPEGKQDPHRLFSHMRSITPTWHDADSGMLYLLNYRDCQEAMRSADFGAPDLLRKSPAFEGSASLQFLADALSNMDPPQHTRIRSQVQRSFSVRVLDRSKAHVEALVAARISDLEKRERFDLVADYAARIPADVICSLLGVPNEDQGKFFEWLAPQFRLLSPTPPTAEVLREADDALAALVSYIESLIASRRENPQVDLISELVATQENSEDPISLREMAVTLAILLAGGTDTTKTAISVGLQLLLEHPDQVRMLHSEPALVRTAFEEIVRYAGAVVVTNSRRALRDTTLGDQSIAAGDYVVPVLAAANRDPDRFENPEQFDITRNPNPHIGFGGGVHVCVGNMLARMVGHVAIPALLSALPGIELEQTTRDVDLQLPAMLGLKTLPVRRTH